MTKRHFIALADKIKAHNSYMNRTRFTQDQIDTLAGFCMDNNPRFDYSRWLDYIEGKCGPNGGKIK